MFNVTEEENAVEVTISSSMRMVDRVVREAREFLREQGDGHFSEFKLVLREMIINAIDHGNGGDIGKQVVVRIEAQEAGRFKLSVSDEGEGFDYKSLNSSLPEADDQIRHRGFPLIFAFADEVVFEENGSRIIAYIAPVTKTVFGVVEEGGWQLVKPSGSLTAEVTDDLRMLLTDLHQKGARKYRFDLADVEDIDSMGLSMLIVLVKMLNKNQQDEVGLELVNVNAEIQRLFKITRLDRSYKIVDQLEEADK